MKKYKYFILIFVALIALLNYKFDLRSPSKSFFWKKTESINLFLSSKALRIKKTFAFISDISNLKNQNETLSKELLKLSVDQSKIEELEHENELLQKELGFIQSGQTKQLLPSRIIGRDPINFFDTLVIDKGSANGVAKGMGVISEGILVGQIEEVFESQSEVTLITSKDSLILVMLQNSRSTGVLRGGISGLVLEDIVQDTNLEPGENVVTSGLDGELEQGVLIGKTGNIKLHTNGLFKSISVEPAVDLSKLEMVFVVI